MSNQMRFDWFTAHVEKCLSEWLEGQELVVDDDGDYVIGWEPAQVYVRLRRDPYWSVEAFTWAVMGLKPRAAVLKEINDVNCRLASATAFLNVDGSVIVHQRVHADGVTAHTLAQAVSAVGGAADSVGVLMAGMFDGHSPFSIETATSDAEET